MKKEGTGHWLAKHCLAPSGVKLCLHRPRRYGYSWSVTNQPENWVCRVGTQLGCVANSVLLFLHTQLLELPIYPQAQTGLHMGSALMTLCGERVLCWKAGWASSCLCPHFPIDHAWTSSKFPGAPGSRCCPLLVVSILSARPKFSHSLVLCVNSFSPPQNISCGSGKGNTMGSCFSVVAELRIQWPSLPEVARSLSPQLPRALGLP